MTVLFQKNYSKLQQLAVQNDISYLGVFGSYARQEETQDSDIDLVVKFAKPGGLLRRAKVKLLLEQIFQKPVDLISQNAINHKLRPHIDKELIDIYPQRNI